MESCSYYFRYRDALDALTDPLPVAAFIINAKATAGYRLDFEVASFKNTAMVLNVGTVAAMYMLANYDDELRDAAKRRRVDDNALKAISPRTLADIKVGKQPMPTST